MSVMEKVEGDSNDIVAANGRRDAVDVDKLNESKAFGTLIHCYVPGDH